MDFSTIPEDLKTILGKGYLSDWRKGDSNLQTFLVVFYMRNFRQFKSTQRILASRIYIFECSK